tara:strand:- start:5677 stop:7629 length:1953 start_codon:yes stop_codon:yes gene_type:complete
MAFENADFDSALFYYQRAATLAKSKPMQNYPRFEGLVLENIGFAYIYGKGRTKEGINFLKDALESHHSKGLIEDGLKTQYNIGYFYMSQSMYDSALVHFENVINVNLRSELQIRLHESYNNAGLAYYYNGRFGQSADYLTKAVKLKEETGETEEIEDTYMNLGSTFESLGDYEKAKDYYRLSMQYFELNNELEGEVTGKQNIAFILIYQDSLEVAKSLLEELLPIYHQTEDQFGVSNYYHALGLIATRKEQFKEAHDLYEKAIQEFPNRVNDRYSANLMTKLGEAKILLAQNDYSDLTASKNILLKESVELGQESLKRSERSNLLTLKLSSAQLLANVYKALGDFELALDYSQLAYELADEVKNKDQSQAIAEVTYEYETDRIENENALLQESQKRQAAQLRQQQYLIVAGLAVLLLIAVIAIVVQRSKLKLKKANFQVEKSLQEKELLLKEIHHRVKNNLQVVSSLLDLQSRGIEDAKALSTFMEGQNRVKAMALIHQKLYQNENLATIDFAEYAEQLMGELASIYSDSNGVKTSVKAGKKTHFDIDTAIPLGLILNELISNAYKYAFAEGKGEIKVSLESLENGKHQLTVTDSGQGLPADFDLSKAKSLGLRLVRRLSKQLYGTAEYYFEQGSKFIITFTDTLERKSV